MSFRSVFVPGLFAGQTVIVTGGGSGIGRCTAHELAALGAHVALVGRDPAKLEKVRAELLEDGGKASAHVCDIRDEATVIATIDAVLATTGRIDGLVNNAGGQYRSEMKSISTKGFEAVVCTNLTGGFVFMREVYTRWMEANGGAIVNMIADIWNGWPNFAHSGASRGGMLTLTESAAAVPRDFWSGADRDRFDTEISNLAAEIGDSHNYAEAVAITLTALTVPLAAWPLVCDTIGVIEFANATAFYIAAASVVGDLGPSEALFAEGEAVTFSCLGVINASAAIITAVMAAGTAAIAISDGAELGAQAGHGNTAALTDFGKATIDSSAEVALAAYGSHEPRQPGRHEAGVPKHRAETPPFQDHRNERVKDRVSEQGNKYVTTPALGALADALLPDDAPNPDDENWGAGEPEGKPGEGPR